MATITITDAARQVVDHRHQDLARPVVAVFWLEPMKDSRRGPNGEAIFFDVGERGWQVITVDWEWVPKMIIVGVKKPSWRLENIGGIEIATSQAVRDYSGDIIVDAVGQGLVARPA